MQRRSSQYWLDLALDAPNADDRRKGVNGLAESKDGTSDWAIKVYETVAKSDQDAMVRCAAVRALGPVAGPQQVPLLLKLMASAKTKYPDIRPAPAPLRWEAAKLLLNMIDVYAYEESQRNEMVSVVLDRLARDNDRNVRLTCIEIVGYFAQQPIPAALVDVLEEDDFTLKQAAEEALIGLTGVTNNRDAKAWRAWLSSVDDPFKNAGNIPDSAQATRPDKGVWDWDF